MYDGSVFIVRVLCGGGALDDACKWGLLVMA